MTKDNKNNRRYDKEEKDRLIARMLPPENISPSDLSKKTGIRQSILSTWKTKATSLSVSRTKKYSRNISSREKFLIVMETYTLSEIDLSKYCREKGLYVEEVKEWRSSCIEANDGIKTNTKDVSEELKEEKKKTKELSKELRIKEKALAETAVLLVLRKKLDLIFGKTRKTNQHRGSRNNCRAG